MRKTLASMIMIAALLLGCTAPAPKPAYSPPPAEMKWVNTDVNKKIASSALTKEDAAREFRMTQAACDLEANRIGVPAPATSGPTSYGCAGGACYGFGQQRDTTATAAAVFQQIAARRACMVSKGWEQMGSDAARSQGGTCLDEACKAAVMP